MKNSFSIHLSLTNGSICTMLEDIIYCVHLDRKSSDRLWLTFHALGLILENFEDVQGP